MEETTAKETPKQKTYVDLHQEFSNLALRAGALAYEVTQQTKELEACYNAMRNISIEGAQAKFREDEEAKKTPTLQEVKNDA